MRDRLDPLSLVLVAFKMSASEPGQLDDGETSSRLHLHPLPSSLPSSSSQLAPPSRRCESWPLEVATPVSTSARSGEQLDVGCDAALELAR